MFDQEYFLAIIHLKKDILKYACIDYYKIQVQIVKIKILIKLIVTDVGVFSGALVDFAKIDHNIVAVFANLKQLLDNG